MALGTESCLPQGHAPPEGVLVNLDFIIIQLIRPTDQEMAAIEKAAP